MPPADAPPSPLVDRRDPASDIAHSSSLRDRILAVNGRAGLLVLSLLALANAVAQSRNAPRGDDIVYLDWAMKHTWPWAALRPLGLFPGWRPLNALSWWLGARLDGAAGTASTVQLALVWLVAWGAWTAWTWRRWGPRAGCWAGALLLLTPPFRDLPIWRSWMSSTGAVASMGLCLLALESGWRRAALLAAAAAACFKETSALPLGLAAWLWYGDRRVPLVALAFAAPSWLNMAHSNPWPGAGEIAQQLRSYVADLSRVGWPAVAAVAAIFLPRRPDLRGVAILGSVLALPLLYPVHNITYLVDGLVLAACLVAARCSDAPTLPRALIAFFMLLAALPTLQSSASDVAYQWERRGWVGRWWEGLRYNPPQAWQLSPEAGDDGKLYGLWLTWRLGLPPDASRAAEMQPLAPDNAELLVIPGSRR